METSQKTRHGIIRIYFNDNATNSKNYERHMVDIRKEGRKEGRKERRNLISAVSPLIVRAKGTGSPSLDVGCSLFHYVSFFFTSKKKK